MAEYAFLVLVKNVEQSDRRLNGFSLNVLCKVCTDWCRVVLFCIVVCDGDF
jgi:hypothetical protein